MKKYFYSNGNEKRGPFSIEELKNENISGESLIWFEGIDDWTMAKELKDMKEILELIPPPIVSEKLNDNSGEIESDEIIEDNEPLNINHHPWRRFFARTVDFCTVGMLIFFLLFFAIGYLFPQNIDSFLKVIENPIVTGIVLYLLWIPFEALFLFFTGTTPAKWVFGIRILNKSGDYLSFSSAIERAFLVFIQGDGFGIPIITIFTRIYAYKRLTKTGTTL